MADGRERMAGPHTEHDLHVSRSRRFLMESLTVRRAAAVRQVAECADAPGSRRSASAGERDCRAPYPGSRARLPVDGCRCGRAPAIRSIAAWGGCSREPVAATTRLTPDMTDTAAHRTHDSRSSPRSPTGRSPDPTAQRAEALVATCGLCAACSTISSRSARRRHAPTPPRVDDYQLTPDDAARLRPGGWRRLVAAIGSGRAAFTRPLGRRSDDAGSGGPSRGDRAVCPHRHDGAGTDCRRGLRPQANEGAEDSSAGGAAARPGHTSAGAGAPAPDAGVNGAATPRSVFAPRASGGQARSEPLRRRVGL